MGLYLLGLKDIVLTDIAPVMPALKHNLKRNKPILEESVGPLLAAMEKMVSDSGVVLLGYQVPHEHLHPDYAYEESDVYIMRKKL
ncbi:putative lysine methyltransferase [Helianthus annuus]|nr:putative lysine methyltransferase [Helianthus annuus]